ncbi:hypothetical protein ABI59_05175 [Acidobacteria bacterium Mor1]|nr:hypothetical protein ABI59_05175 [Acidobacteria bacterium Mor1]
MKRVLAAAFILIATALIVAQLAVPHQTVVAAERDPGETAFIAAKCNLCHAVSSAGIEAKMKGKMTGPDLKGLAAEYEEGWLERYLRKEADLDGKKHVKAFEGKEDELRKIVTWLEAQP